MYDKSTGCIFYVFCLIADILTNVLQKCLSGPLQNIPFLL